jgi:predicted  nucleic acid-binding Zn-ribbon protein
MDGRYNRRNVATMTNATPKMYKILTSPYDSIKAGQVLPLENHDAESGLPQFRGYTGALLAFLPNQVEEVIDSPVAAVAPPRRFEVMRNPTPVFNLRADYEMHSINTEQGIVTLRAREGLDAMTWTFDLAAVREVATKAEPKPLSFSPRRFRVKPIASSPAFKGDYVYSERERKISDGRIGLNSDGGFVRSFEPGELEEVFVDDVCQTIACAPQPGVSPARLSELRSNVADLEKRNYALTLERDEWKSASISCSRANGEINERLDGAYDRIKDLVEAHGRKDEELSKSADNSVRIVEDNENLRSSLSLVTGDFEAECVKNRELREAIEALGGKITRFIDQRNGFRDKLYEVMAQRTKLENTVDVLKASVKVSQSKLDAYASTASEAQRETAIADIALAGAREQIDTQAEIIVGLRNTIEYQSQLFLQERAKRKGRVLRRQAQVVALESAGRKLLAMNGKLVDHVNTTTAGNDFLIERVEQLQRVNAAHIDYADSVNRQVSKLEGWLRSCESALALEQRPLWHKVYDRLVNRSFWTQDSGR